MKHNIKTSNKKIQDYPILYDFLKKNNCDVNNIKITDFPYPDIYTYSSDKHLFEYMSEAQQIIIYPYLDIDKKLYQHTYSEYIRAYIYRDEQEIKQNRRSKKIKRIFDEK